MKRKKSFKGFTLIEVMVTVAIIAILAAIAYPSYADHVIRGRIPAALAELSNSRVAMEQYFADNRAYVNTSAGTNACQAARLGSDRSLKEGFTVTCAVTATTYTITATGTSGRVNGFIYTINQDGTKATTGVPAHSGWITKTSCWVIKKDGSC